MSALSHGFEFDSEKMQPDEVFLALASICCKTGEQAGGLLQLIELLTHKRLMSWVDASRIVRLLCDGSPEAQRRVIARCVFQRKAKPIRLPVSAIRHR